MNFIIGLIVIICINLAFRFVISSLRAAGRTAMGKGNFKDNLSNSFLGMGDFEMRLLDTEVGEANDKKLKAKTIEVRGKFPVSKPQKTALVISILDTTDEESEPVLSVLEEFQEKSTTAFQAILDMGVLQPGYGLPNWVKVGGFFPDFLETPYKGARKLSVFIRLVDIENPPSIRLGFHDKNAAGLSWIQGQAFEHHSIYVGYKEEAENRIKAHCAIIKLGVYAAMSDDNFAQEEADAINRWLPKVLSSYGDQVDHIKKVLYDTYNEAFKNFKNGTLSLSEICGVLNEINSNSFKYEAIELCYDIIAADKTIDADELAFVNKISTALKLDYKEIEKIKDNRLVGINSSVQGSASVEDILGITPNMTNDEVNAHLRKEFQKWNSRLNILPEGDEREQAQRMLDLIAEIRNKRAA